MGSTARARKDDSGVEARFLARTGADAGGEFGYGYFWWYSCYPTAKGLIEACTAVGQRAATNLCATNSEYGCDDFRRPVERLYYW